MSGGFLFARKGEILFRKVVGKVHVHRDDLISSQSPFNVGSVSKQFTAMAIMLLNHQGKLTFDQKVAFHLPDFPYADIRIRHLLNHTSGTIDYEKLTDKHWQIRDFTNQDMVNLLKRFTPDLAFNPGARFD
ncbi:serine hydrolase [Endozoicomonas sp. G2_1]|nr:serine hydrolase [Endozoicomonas sp. G2_1]